MMVFGLGLALAGGVFVCGFSMGRELGQREGTPEDRLRVSRELEPLYRQLADEGYFDGCLVDCRR